VIRLTEVHLDAGAEDLVLGVLRSGHLAQGPMVESFEQQFAKIAGSTHGVAMSSGTTALAASFQALGLGPGDEVVTTPFTFVATLNAIIGVGATVRLVDIDPLDFTIDPDHVAAAVTARTRAIVPVHLYGYPADMGRLARIAGDAGVVLVEDAAQAHGARVDGRPVGSWGAGVFSFYATKNMTTGEGGMVTTDDDALADRLRLLRNQGMRARYQYEMVGTNYRMTDIQAAIGLSQLPFLDEWTERRRANAAALTEALADVEGLDLPREAGGRQHVYHQYTIRVRDDASLDRDGLAAALHDAGVESGIYYPRMAHDYECFRVHPLVQPGSVPNAAQAARQVLSLPVHQWLGPEDVAQVGKAVRSALQ